MNRLFYNFFDAFSELFFYNQQEFHEKLERERARFYSTNIDCQPNINFPSLHSFYMAKNVPPSFQVSIKRIPFYCLYREGPKSGLVVIFNGSRTVPKETDNYRFLAPRFSYSNLCDYHFLFIDDPMFYLYPTLSLGWYYGTAELPFILLANVLIKLLIKKLSIPREQIIYFSSSGGGYASLVASCYMPGTMSISINPQLILSEYHTYSEFNKITKIDLQIEEKYNRNNIPRLLVQSKSTHVLIVNTRDKMDIEKQLMPIMRQLKFPIKYGINIRDKLLVWLYEAIGVPHPHTSFETRPLFMAIFELANLFKKGLGYSLLQSMSLIINEIWSEHYKMKKKISHLPPSSDVIILDGEFCFPSEYQKITILDDFRIPAYKHNYHHKRLFKVEPYHLYNIIFIFERNEGKEFSFGLYDFSNLVMIDIQTSAISHEVTYSFLSGKAPNCDFICYADVIGKTFLKSLTVKRITISSVPIVSYQNIKCKY